MNDDVPDWSVPIDAPPLSQLESRLRRLLWRRSSWLPRFAERDLAAVRNEQLRRAAILLTAAGGKPLTKGTVEDRFNRLAAVVPGLRYRVGSSEFARLARDPFSSVRNDELPGGKRGRRQKWTRQDKIDLAWMVDSYRRVGTWDETPRATLSPRNRDADMEALRDFLHLARERGHHPPGDLTMENLLLEGRKLIEEDARARVVTLIPSDLSPED